MCPLWRIPPHELQRMHYIQRPSAENIPPLRPKTYFPPLKSNTPPAQNKPTLHTQPGVTYGQITKQHPHTPTNMEHEPYINQPHQQTSDIQELKTMLKSLFEQMGTMLNLLTTVLTKLK
jgi:hypothetical protein